ncbi:MAG: M24 family metallopeptidase [Thermoplasmata archaeon]
MERDTYIFFYELFKKINRNIDVIDITDDLDNTKVINDKYEIGRILKAGELTKRVGSELSGLIREGMKETEIAAEAYYRLYRAGSEEPFVYVNAGSNPRVHSEPLSTAAVENDSVVTFTLDGDFFRYYVDKSFAITVGNPGDNAINAIK